MEKSNILKVGMAQIAPVWLNRQRTLEKMISYVYKAGKDDCSLLVFGEALLPGYPFWLELTGGATFNSKKQKEIHAHYIRNAVQVEAGDLDPLCRAAAQNRVAVYAGIIERAKNRGGHSLYCSLVYINAEGEVKSVHRKLQPTYDERLVWAQGDGNGLRVHSLPPFTLGGLNCWENWMPLPRTALYGQGENLHIAVWPGSKRNTEDISRFIAKEARSYVVSVGALMNTKDIGKDIPYRDEIIRAAIDPLTDGGSCIAGPDGEWVLEPRVNEEGLFTAELNFNRVLEERQNFDASGHYSRPDVTRLTINRERQSTIRLED